MYGSWTSCSNGRCCEFGHCSGDELPQQLTGGEVSLIACKWLAGENTMVDRFADGKAAADSACSKPFFMHMGDPIILYTGVACPLSL